MTKLFNKLVFFLMNFVMCRGFLHSYHGFAIYHSITILTGSY